MSSLSYSIAHPDAIPQELQALDQWVIRDEQKRPINARTGKLASPTDADTWSSFTTAAATGRSLGFVFTEDDPYVGIDLDRCRDPETGAIAPEAMAIIERFSSYAEVSPSGTGVHLILRGVKPTRECTRTLDWGKVECYDAGRYFTMTGNVLPGHDTIRNCQRELTAWHREVWPVEPERLKAPGIPTAGAVDDRDLIARLERDAKAGQLLAGNMAGYPSPSEARGALAYKCIFYGADGAEQIVNTILSAGLFRDGTTERERERKARRDAEGALTRYTGPRYDPNHRSTPHLTIVPNTTTDALSCPPQLIAAQARNAELEAGIAVRDETIARQAARLDQYSVLVTAIEKILATNQVEAGPKTTAVALVLEIAEQERRGKPSAELGRHIPGKWVGDRAAKPVDTANKHLKQMGDAGLIDRRVVKERVLEDTVDEDTGEIIPRGKTISRTYYPDQASALIAKFTSYQRPEGATRHGGDHRRCKDHPHASTTTTHTTTCDECGAVLDEHVTRHQPQECDTHDACSTTTVGNSKGPPIMHVPPATRMMPVPPEHPDAPPLDDEPPDYWMPPGWEDEHRRTYGAVYRGGDR